MKVFDQSTVASSRPIAADAQRGHDFNAVLLAMAGHDLRQPLQVILNSYAWLAERHTGDHERIDRGKRAIAQLTGQLDHLIEALRIHERAARVEPAPLRIQTLFDSLCRDNAGTAARNGVELRFAPTSIMAMSDAVLLDGILRNLVRNAIKYTPRAERILLGCRRLGGDVRIGVHDTGIGIAPDHLARVFDAFHRVDSTRPDGLGLGLFVVRHAADLLGHRIEVRSKVDIGSCFSIVTPAARRP
jgi:signal transduction histidine kinase